MQNEREIAISIDTTGKSAGEIYTEVGRILRRNCPGRKMFAFCADDDWCKITKNTVELKYVYRQYEDPFAKTNPFFQYGGGLI